MTTINILNDYTITNYSGSLNENTVRNPSSDTTAATASCAFTVNATMAHQLDGLTIVFEDTNGLQKTYIFDDDGDGATGTVDGSGRVRVQITSGEGAAGLQLRDAVHSANGHDGSLIITQDSLSSNEFIIKQRDPGASGNTTVSGTTISGAVISSGLGFNKFTGGSSSSKAYKAADVLPYKFSISGPFNIRGQTTESRYRVFLG